MKAKIFILTVLFFGALTLNAATNVPSIETQSENITFSEKTTGLPFFKKVFNKQAVKPNADILEVILSFLLPPVAVFLHSGIGTYFWISLLLTIFMWVPGVIFSLLVVLDII